MLNRIFTKLAVVAVATTGLLGATAHATAVTATASFTDLSLTRLEASNHQYFVDASIPGQTDFDFALTPFTFFSSTPAGMSLAQIDNTFNPLPGTHAAATKQGEAHSSLLWFFDWTATETGKASISLEYLFDATILNLFAGDSAIARSYASLQLDGTSLFTSSLNFLDTVGGNLNDFKTLGLSFDVREGQTGTFTMALASDALVEVPTPATLPLLASSLAGLFAFRRRRIVAA